MGSKDDERTCRVSDLKFVSSVLSLGGSNDDVGDLWESIWWRTDGEYAPVTFFVNCNDLFYWACADLERLTPENLPLLLVALDDVRHAQGLPRGEWPRNLDIKDGWDEWHAAGAWASSLFCARIRGMRPQRPCYRGMPDKLKPLFDACGPERDPKSEG